MTWLAAFCGLLIVTVTAQEAPAKAGASPAPTPAKEELSLAPAKVDVKPVARDEEIRQRLQGVMEATDWFTAPEVLLPKAPDHSSSEEPARHSPAESGSTKTSP